MKFASLSVNPYIDVYQLSEEVAEYLIKHLEIDKTTKLSRYILFKIRTMIFQSAWRVCAIVMYTQQSKLLSPDVIYCSTRMSKLFNGHLSKILYKRFNESKIVIYTNFGMINDQNYLYREIKNRVKYIGRLLNNVLSILVVFSFVPIRFKRYKDKVDAVLFSHDQKRLSGWLNGVTFAKNISCKHWIVLPDGRACVQSKCVRFLTLHYSKILHFYCELTWGLLKYSCVRKLGMHYYATIIREWKNYVLLKSTINELGVYIIYSDHESDVSQLACAMAADSDSIISFAAGWSYGYFPAVNVAAYHKFVDRFFVWGGAQMELIRASGDESSGYIVSGYIGDVFLEKMKAVAIVIRRELLKKYNYIIAVYDTTVAHDLFFNETEAKEFLNTILLSAKKTNSAVILKTKKNPECYSGLVKKAGDMLLLEHEQGTLIPALAADVAVGVATSSPVMVSAVYNKNVVLYDSAYIVWDEFKENLSKSIFCHTLPELEKSICNSLDNVNNDAFEWVDPFGDACAQKRYGEYICDVVSMLPYGKIKALHLADENYSVKWGGGKVFSGAP